MENKIVITIARQFGSGGREIGNRLSEILGIPLYDRELITAAAEEGNLHPELAEKNDEKAANSLLYTLAVGSNIFTSHHKAGLSLPINDRLYMLQSDFIREKAAEGSCIIVGRCADHILKDNENRFSVFVYAPLSVRRRRVTERHPELTENQALELINKTDKRRATYYNFYTGGKWGKYENYQMALDSGAMGIEATAELLAEAARRFMAKGK